MKQESPSVPKRNYNVVETHHGLDVTVVALPTSCLNNTITVLGALFGYQHTTTTSNRRLPGATFPRAHSAARTTPLVFFIINNSTVNVSQQSKPQYNTNEQLLVLRGHQAK